jgi:hypothetical protein
MKVYILTFIILSVISIAFAEKELEIAGLKQINDEVKTHDFIYCKINNLKSTPYK